MNIEGRSIFGYFSDRVDAEEAKERLIHAGLAQTSLDSVDRFDAAETDAQQEPLAGGFPGLTSLALGDDVDPSATGAALSADNAASGYGAVGNPARERMWLVVSVTDGSDAEVERAVKIMKQYGGEV